MDRTTFLEIGGKIYPMRFSLSALREINNKYGSLEKMVDAVAGQEQDGMDMIQPIIWMLDLLIRQGCAYKNLFEKDVPVPENASVVNGKWEPISVEAIEIGIGIDQIGDVKDKIFSCIVNGQKKTIETEPKEKNEKNTMTT